MIYLVILHFVSCLAMSVAYTMVCGVCIIMVVLLATHGGGVETDYCKVNMGRCDKDGIYKYKWLTGYEDFVIRDLVDDQLENILAEPMTALQRSRDMLKTFPNRYTISQK